MSDQPTAANTPDLPPDPSRANELAAAALRARLVRQKAQQQNLQARVDELVGSTKALLLNYWSTFGIDPNKYTLDDRNRPHWSGSITLADEADSVRLNTTVGVFENGLHFRVGTAYGYKYSERQHVDGTLPKEPPTDEEIGSMLLDGWIEARQQLIKERQDKLQRLLNEASCQGTGHFWDTREASLNNLAASIIQLVPGDIPHPFETSLAKLREALAKASQRVEAHLQLRAEYVGAAARIKELAKRWQRHMIEWDEECAAMARELSARHFAPFTVYAIRYTAVGAPLTTVDEDGDLATSTETIHTLQDPLPIAQKGQAIAVEDLGYYGERSTVVIGAFLDSRVAFEATAPATPSSSRRFWRTRQIGQSEYYAFFPPTFDNTEIDNFMATLSFPQPPKPFTEAILDTLRVRITTYHFMEPDNWANVDPAQLREGILELNVPKDAEPAEEETPIPF